MKKTIAAILVAVIAGLASPTVFAVILHFPPSAENQEHKSPSFWDKLYDLLVHLGGD